MSKTLARQVVDDKIRQRAVNHIGKSGVRLLRLTEIADPLAAEANFKASVYDIDPDAPDPANLYRVHWHNAETDDRCRMYRRISSYRRS